MKSVFVSAVLFITLANCYPARERLDLSDVDFDPFDGEGPIVDTGYFDGLPQLDGFYKRLQDVISSLRQSITNRTGGFVSSIGDLGPGNTTSYTQIIGNHKVEVNETEYKKDTDFGTSHVKVSFINVRPLDADTIEPKGSTEADTESVIKPNNADRESLEDSVENEINPENTDIDIETLDMMDNKNQPEFARQFPIPYRQPSIYLDGNDIDNEIDAINTDVGKIGPIRDLSNDISVNDRMYADGVTQNPDAEFIFY